MARKPKGSDRAMAFGREVAAARQDQCDRVVRWVFLCNVQLPGVISVRYRRQCDRGCHVGRWLVDSCPGRGWHAWCATRVRVSPLYATREEAQAWAERQEA